MNLIKQSFYQIMILSHFSCVSTIFSLDRIRPICLPITNDLLHRRFVNMMPFLAGWGYLGETIHKISPVLMQVQVPVVENHQCKESYRKIDQVQKDPDLLSVLDTVFDDRTVCAGFTEGGKDSCQGDSGGPLMLPLPDKNGNFPFYQIGIISSADGCAKPNIPGINANVQYYADWIKKKLAKKIQ